MKYFIIIIFSVSVSADDLKSVLKEIVELHPDVRKRTFLHKAARADSERAGTLPDPKIGLAYRNYPNYGGIRFDESRLGTPTMTGKEIMISQEIPYPEKNTLAKKISEEKAKEISVDVISAKNVLARELMTAEISRRFSLDKLKIRKEILKLYASVSSISRTYNSVNQKPAFLSLQNTANQTQERIRTVETESLLELSSVELSRFAVENPKLMEKFKSSDLLGFLDTHYRENKTNDFEKTIPDRNPEIRKTVQTAAVLEAEKKLSVLNTSAPDAEVFVAYMYRKTQKYMFDNGTAASASGNWMIQDNTEYRGNLVSAGITFKVPVWSFMNHKSEKERADLNLSANSAEKEMGIRTVTALLKKNYAEIDYLAKAIVELENRLIPELEKTVRLIETSYKTGKADYADIALSRINLLQARLGLLEIREKKYSRIVSILEITDSFFE